MYKQLKVLLSFDSLINLLVLAIHLFILALFPTSDLYHSLF